MRGPGGQLLRRSPLPTEQIGSYQDHRSANDVCKILFPPEAIRMPPQAQRVSEQRNEDKKHAEPEYGPREH